MKGRLILLVNAVFMATKFAGDVYDYRITVCENLKTFRSDVTLKPLLGLYWKLVNFKYFEVRSFKPFPDQRSQEDNATFPHFPLQPVVSIAYKLNLR